MIRQASLFVHRRSATASCPFLDLAFQGQPQCHLPSSFTSLLASSEPLSTHPTAIMRWNCLLFVIAMVTIPCILQTPNSVQIVHEKPVFSTNHPHQPLFRPDGAPTHTVGCPQLTHELPTLKIGSNLLLWAGFLLICVSTRPGSFILHQWTARLLSTGPEHLFSFLNCSDKGTHWLVPLAFPSLGLQAAFLHRTRFFIPHQWTARLLSTGSGFFLSFVFPRCQLLFLFCWITEHWSPCRIRDKTMAYQIPLSIPTCLRSLFFFCFDC